MLDAVREAPGFAATRSRADLDHDRLLLLALVKDVEIIGEAASRVSADTRAEWAEIPWQDIVTMRHRLVHGYFDIDLDIVWNTLTDDLPPLAARKSRASPPVDLVIVAPGTTAAHRWLASAVASPGDSLGIQPERQAAAMGCFALRAGRQAGTMNRNPGRAHDTTEGSVPPTRIRTSCRTTGRRDQPQFRPGRRNDRRKFGSDADSHFAPDDRPAR